MAKNKIKPVLTCGCKVTNLERPFSQYNHNKDCSCETINQKGQVKKFKFAQMSIYKK